MNKTQFDKYVNYIIDKSRNTLIEKNGRYAPEDDALHNFHVGAQIDGSTTAQTIWHYMKKHLVALLDKIQNDDWSNREDVEEKIQDLINYLVFMYCASKEDDARYEDYDNYGDCSYCKYFDAGDFDNITGRCTAEPCKSCKHNFCPNEPEYETAPVNWCPEDEERKD